MKPSANQICRKFNRPIVAAFAVWLSGLVCLFCCAVACADSSAACDPSEAAAVEVAAAEESGEHACCARQRKAEAAVEAAASCAPAPDGAIVAEPEMDGCCGMHARATGAAPVPAGVQTPSAESVNGLLPPFFAAPVSQHYVREAIPPLNRGDTHLRCCVFLI